MNRTIKFRGKDLATGKWVYGDLLRPITSCRIVNYTEVEEDGVKRADYHYYDVNPDTIGQFTGLLDSRGIEIYEDDIVRITSLTGVMTWNPFATCFYIDTEGKMPSINTMNTPLGEMWKSHWQELIIVGNATDNPELLEKV